MSDAVVRLFFALWPDEATRRALASCASAVVAQTGGREVAADNLHLTLAFIGERPVAWVSTLCEAADGVRVSPIQLRLDEIGCWRKSGIAWLASSTANAEVVAMQARLLATLAGIGIVFPESRFTPHVTLARKIVKRVALKLEKPVAWDSAAFVLVASELGPGGVRYRVVEKWPRRT
jgi:RNA 2',3'-cyclic 3'-phosphodiesterase